MSLKWLRGLYSRWAPEDGFEKYNTVPEDDKSDFGDAVNGNSSLIASLAPQRRQSWRRPNSTQLILLGLSISLLTFTSLYINLRLSLRPPSRLHCGWTIEEAQARGCAFDTLSKAWLPSACPLYGLDEYMDAGVAVSNDTEKPWPFYRDKEHKQEISVREMSHMAYAYKGGPEFRTSNREHVTHCAWMLTRMAHAYSTGQRRDVNSDKFEHNKHCALFLLGVALKAPDIDDIGVRGNVIFGGC